ncbi:DMT family transporter [Halomonas shantousis]
MTRALNKASPSQHTYYPIVLLSTFLQGSSFVAAKISLLDMPPLWVAALRFFVAALSLLPVAMTHHFRSNASLRSLPWGRLCILGLLQTTGVMAFLNIGLLYTTSSTAAILMASNPLLVAALAGVVLGEQVSRRGIGGILLAFVGVVTCIGGGQLGRNGIGIGEIYVMLASTCWALSTLFNKKSALSVSPWIITFWQMLIGSVLLCAIAFVEGTPLALPSTPYHWLAFLWLAIPASTGAMGTWFAALKIGGAVHTSGFLFLCPLFAALISFFITGNVIQAHELLGGGLIGTGIYLISRSEQSAKRKAY